MTFERITIYPADRRIVVRCARGSKPRTRVFEQGTELDEKIPILDTLARCLWPAAQRLKSIFSGLAKPPAGQLYRYAGKDGTSEFDALPGVEKARRREAKKIKQDVAIEDLLDQQTPPKTLAQGPASRRQTHRRAFWIHTTKGSLTWHITM